MNRDNVKELSIRMSRQAISMTREIDVLCEELELNRIPFHLEIPDKPNSQLTEFMNSGQGMMNALNNERGLTNELTQEFTSKLIEIYLFDVSNYRERILSALKHNRLSVSYPNIDILVFDEILKSELNKNMTEREATEFFLNL